MLCDAQTSGGLLAAVPGTHAAEVVRHLRYHGLASAALVGCIEAGEPGRIRVRRSPNPRYPDLIRQRQGRAADSFDRHAIRLRARWIARVQSGTSPLAERRVIEVVV